MPNAAHEMPARLAESAFQLFASKGFKQVNVDQIAARAGVTKGSVYWHFQSKDELIKAACTHYYRAYHQRIHDELSIVSDPVRRLERALEVSVRICLLDEENRVFTTEVFSLMLHDGELRRGWRQFYDSVREFYVGLVKAAMAAGAISPSDAGQAVDFMLAAMEGIKLQALFDPGACAPAREQAILASLKAALGFPETPFGIAAIRGGMAASVSTRRVGPRGLRPGKSRNKLNSAPP
jgi:AcrR family transcriptional regulator